MKKWESFMWWWSAECSRHDVTIFPILPSFEITYKQPHHTVTRWGLILCFAAIYNFFQRIFCAYFLFSLASRTVFWWIEIRLLPESDHRHNWLDQHSHWQWIGQCAKPTIESPKKKKENENLQTVWKMKTFRFLVLWKKSVFVIDK